MTDALAPSRAARSSAEFSALLEAIGDGVPNPAQYKVMYDMALDFPEARDLARLDPFSRDYRQAALDFYLSLRGPGRQGYEAARDEVSNAAPPDNPWTALVPWSSRDANTVSEHLMAWGHIFRHLNMPPGGSVLEYGPGSGQILLMLARSGYRSCGVDIDPMALAGIRAQSAHLDLSVETEQAAFGYGFEGRTFDSILFYEAFHHALDFDQVLLRLHTRLNPGGRVVLCGEPVVAAPCPAVPYPWGPRLDALSVFCMRRFGWMELGFTHDFLMTLLSATGWTARLHRFPRCPRAALYVLEPKSGLDPRLDRAARGDRMASHASAAWRLSRPLRATKGLLIQGRRALRNVFR